MKEFFELVEDRGNEYGIIVRRIGHPSLRALRGLGVPRQRRTSVEDAIVAYRVYPDGREEPIRNVVLSGIDVSAFRDIVAASKDQTVHSTPMRGRAGGREISIVVPDLLFEEIAIRKLSGEIPNPPVAKHPFFKE